MKNSIAWHKECLNNQRNYYNKLLEEARRVIEQANQNMKAIQRLSDQIAEAERLGKYSFDPERFMKKRADKLKGRG